MERVDQKFDYLLDIVKAIAGSHPAAGSENLITPESVGHADYGSAHGVEGEVGTDLAFRRRVDGRTVEQFAIAAIAAADHDVGTVLSNPAGLERCQDFELGVIFELNRGRSQHGDYPVGRRGRLIGGLDALAHPVSATIKDGHQESLFAAKVLHQLRLAGASVARNGDGAGVLITQLGKQMLGGTQYAIVRRDCSVG